MMNNVNDLLSTEKACQVCGGDGISRCDNPDHGFIESMQGEIGRLGCPVCGFDSNYKVHGETCETCNGDGVIPIYYTPKQFKEITGKNLSRRIG